MGANVGGIHALHYKAASMYGFLITSCWCVAIGLFSHQNNMRRKVTISLPSGSFATTYLKDRYTHTHTHLFHSQIYSPKCLQQPGLGQAKARSWEFSLGLLCGWQRPKNLSYHLLPPVVYIISRKLERESEPMFKPRHSNMRWEHIKCIFMMHQIPTLTHRDRVEEPKA